MEKIRIEYNAVSTTQYSIYNNYHLDQVTYYYMSRTHK